MAKAFMRLIRSPQRKLGLADLGKITDKEIRTAMNDKVKPNLVKRHEEIVKDWKSDVGFAARMYNLRDSIAVYVFPTGKDKKIWSFVDQGTRPHRMPAVYGKLMVFRAGGKYVPKTTKRAYGGPGVVVGGVKTFTTSRKEFTHPGNEPRGFTVQIAEDIKPDFKKEVENAFRRAATKVNGG